MAYSTIPKSTSYFNTKLYNGSSSTQSITGLNFQPDLTWIKRRNSARGHTLFDVVRTATYGIYSESNDVQSAAATSLTAFTSDGFTLGADDRVSGSGNTMVSWNWKAGTAVSGATTGGGTAKTYTGSVNTTAGFSIINYIGNSGSGHQIPHRLGVTPQMIIVKCLNQAQGWTVYHQSLGSGTPQNYWIRLDETGGETSASDIWYNTAPNATNFTVGSSDNVNGGLNYIAYCFTEKQGYSKFGKYIGNGNADGPFQYLGFKPAFVMFKRTSSTDNWVMIDNRRLGYNDLNYGLFPNTTAAEQTSTDFRFDLLSNGFKIKNSSGYTNASGQSYIYMAFGQPIVSTNGDIATAR